LVVFVRYIWGISVEVWANQDGIQNNQDQGVERG
jgi:hypothetical protein